jgi:hypothetical protein
MRCLAYYLFSIYIQFYHRNIKYLVINILHVYSFMNLKVDRTSAYSPGLIRILWNIPQLAKGGIIIIIIFYSETTPVQRGQTSAGYQCLRLIIINKQIPVYKIKYEHKAYTNIK